MLLLQGSHHLFYRIGDAVKGNLDFVFGEGQGGATGLGIAIKHAAGAAGIDKVCSLNVFVVGRMGMAGDDDLAVCYLAELLETSIRGLGKEQLSGVVRAAMEKPDAQAY